jgi:4-hydroxybenzoate polyprenyltransferase
VILYLAGIVWTLFYDTIYAHQDTEDDALIGIKSTARLFGENSPTWLRRFLVGTLLLMATAIVVALMPDANPLVLVIALAGPWAMGFHMTWQLRSLDVENAPVLLRLFRSNRDAGLIPLAFLCVAILM